MTSTTGSAPTSSTSPRTRPAHCPMTPTCSRYALDALAWHGTARGLRLVAGRLRRCRPAGTHGDDPVPPAT
ncbi:MAG TPA: membrane protein insertion efficiency factor YidD [Streptosporangiaceae bacterium]